MKSWVLGMVGLVVLCMASLPVTAATQWNFGASLRYTTFVTEQNAKESGMHDLQGGGAALRNDGILDWGTQGNSRLKMYMHSDSLEGYIELGYSFSRNKLTTRQYWGKYRFNDRAYIIVGQHPQLFNQLISNQVWDTDWGMIGIGANYRSGTPKIILGYGGWAVALGQSYHGRNAAKGAFAGVAANPTNHGYTFGALADTDVYFPQLQIRYEHVADTWRVKLAGAYQYIKAGKIRPYIDGSGLGGTYTEYFTNSTNINSWLFGVDGDISFGPLLLAAAFSVGQNWSDAGWNDENSCMSSLWTGNYVANNFGIFPKFDIAGPLVNGQKIPVSWENTTSAMASIVADYQLTEALRFEAGIGYRHDHNKAFARDSRMWTAYLQAGYTVAPGFTVTPEIGVVDFGKHVTAKTDNGYLWYIGAQWRMDF